MSHTIVVMTTATTTVIIMERNRREIYKERMNKNKIK